MMALNMLLRVSTVCLLAPSSTVGRVVPSSIPNFRDLGGTRCGTGCIRPGVLYRSATPSNVTEEDAMRLPVSTVLDLRSAHDAQKDAGARVFAPKTAHLPLLNEAMMRRAMIERAKRRPSIFVRVVALGLAKKLMPWASLKDRIAAALDQRLAKLFDTVALSDVYWLIVSESAEELKRAFELLSRDEALPLLVHCTHGKDRTGVLVALLLLALGASEEDVVADYVRSHDWGMSSHGRRQMVQSFPERLRPHLRDGLIEEWCCAPESAIRAVLRRLESEHGSVEAYLDSIGVDAARRKRLAEALLTTEGY